MNRFSFISISLLLILQINITNAQSKNWQINRLYAELGAVKGANLFWGGDYILITIL